MADRHSTGLPQGEIMMYKDDVAVLCCVKSGWDAILFHWDRWYTGMYVVGEVGWRAHSFFFLVCDLFSVVLIMLKHFRAAVMLHVSRSYVKAVNFREEEIWGLYNCN